MDATFIQIHITGQEKIFLLIWIKDYKWQPLTACLRTGENESPTWASTTSILHHFDSKLTSKGQAWEEQSSAPKGQRDADSSIVLETMDYSFDTLNSLLCFQCLNGSLYSFSKWYWKVESVRSQGIWKARSHMSRIQDKECSNSFGLCTHLDVRDYRGNIHVCTRLSRKRPRISLF